MKSMNQRCSILTIALVIGSVIFTSCSSASSDKSANVSGSAGSQENKSATVENKNTAPKPTPETAQNKQTDVLPSFKKGEDYKSSVRVKMLKEGWKPAPTEDSEKCGSGDSRCDEYPEMESCAGSGMGNCKFLWEKGGKVAAIFTVDDPYLFSSSEVQKSSNETKPTNLIGKYIYQTKHESGTDEFVYQLKANNVAVYSSVQEGGDDGDKTGSWSFNEAKKTVTLTLSNAQGGKEIYVFKLKGKNLEMTAEPPHDKSYTGFTGTTFLKQ